MLPTVVEEGKDDNKGEGDFATPVLIADTDDKLAPGLPVT